MGIVYGEFLIQPWEFTWKSGDGWMIIAHTMEQLIEEIKRFGYYEKYLKEQEEEKNEKI